MTAIEISGSCKVLDCNDKIRIKKLQLCTKHEARFRKYGDTSVVKIPEKKFIIIPDGPIIQKRHTIESLEFIVKTLGPKMRYGYIENSEKLKEEIQNLLDDVKNINGSFSRTTERYYNYIEKLCESPETKQFGLIPIDKLETLYVISLTIPNSDKISFQVLVEKIKNSLEHRAFNKYFGSERGSEIKKLLDEKNDLETIRKRKNLTREEFDKVRDLMFDLDSSIIRGNVGELLRYPGIGIIFNEVYVRFEENEETIRTRAKRIIQEKGIAYDGDLAIAKIHRGRFKSEDQEANSYNGWADEIIKLILKNGFTRLEDIPKIIDGEKVDEISKILDESDGLLVKQDDYIKFNMTEKYQDILDIAQKIKDEKPDIDITDILDQIGFDVYGHATKKQMFADILITHFLIK